MKKTFLLLTFFAFGKIIAQSELFPSHLNIKPFIAATIEPKLGFMFKTDKDELRLDIGNSLDVFHVESKKVKFSFGADLFTWTFLRQEEDFHFPVDAVDYLFGINFGIKTAEDENSFGARIRLSHISAHMVDGRYDKLNSKWINGQLPRVYSREFVEVNPFFQMSNLRIYGGFTYLFHVDPDIHSREQVQLGIELYRRDFVMNYFTPFVAFDVKAINGLANTKNYSLNAGLKFGNALGRGMSIYYQYYSGYNIHGEFFDVVESYSGIGLNLEF